MKLHRFLPVVAAVALLLASTPSFGVAKEIIQLQTQVQQIQDQMARMQQSFDAQLGVMRHLIEQQTDTVNKVNSSMVDLQKSLAQQDAGSAARNDQVSGQIQALNDSLDELKARLAKVSTQLEQVANNAQTLPAQPTSAPAPQAPPPDVLYDNALSDYNANKLDLATQEFGDYLKYYPTTDLAGNAQFYLADIEYKQQNYAAAVKDYDVVLQQYPGGNKTPAAQLKKGMALAQLGQREAAVKALNGVIQRYPKSIEATDAREELRKLNGPGAARRHPQT